MMRKRMSQQIERYHQQVPSNSIYDYTLYSMITVLRMLNQSMKLKR